MAVKKDPISKVMEQVVALDKKVDTKLEGLGDYFNKTLTDKTKVLTDISEDIADMKKNK